MITKIKKAVASAKVEQEPVAASKDLALSSIIAERMEDFFNNHKLKGTSESSYSLIRFEGKVGYENVGCCGPVSNVSDSSYKLGYKIAKRHLSEYLKNKEVLKEYISILNKYLKTEENGFNITFVNESNTSFEIEIEGVGGKNKLFLVQLIRAYQANYEFFFMAETFMKNICYVYEEKIPFFAYLYMCFYPAFIGNRQPSSGFGANLSCEKIGRSSITYSPFNSLYSKTIVDYSFISNKFCFIAKKHRYDFNDYSTNNISMLPIITENFFTNEKFKNYTPLSDTSNNSIFYKTLTGNKFIYNTLTTNTLFFNIHYLLHYYILSRTINGDNFLTRMYLLSKLTTWALSIKKVQDLYYLIELYNKNTTTNKIDLTDKNVQNLLNNTNYLIQDSNNFITYEKEIALLDYFIQNLFYNKKHNTFFNTIIK